jgi:hypothetical protein
MQPLNIEQGVIKGNKSVIWVVLLILLIVAHSMPGIITYLPGKKFWYADIKDYGTFVTHNQKYLAGTMILNL